VRKEEDEEKKKTEEKKICVRVKDRESFGDLWRGKRR
jgi:hypothetical protein